MSDSGRLHVICEESGSRRANEAEASPSGAQATQPPSQHGDLKEDRQRDNYQENINVLKFFMLKKKKKTENVQMTEICLPASPKLINEHIIYHSADIRM